MCCPCLPDTAQLCDRTRLKAMTSTPSFSSRGSVSVRTGAGSGIGAALHAANSLARAPGVTVTTHPADPSRPGMGRRIALRAQRADSPGRHRR